MMTVFTLRSLTPDDEPFIWDMLYEALYVPEGEEPPSRDVLQQPGLAHYAEGWGKPGDHGLRKFRFTNT